LIGLLAVATLCVAAEAPRVLVRTELGDILIEVYPDKAPITAANFLSYVDARLYDGAVFHRTVTLANQPKDQIKIEVVQGALLRPEKAFPPIAHETTEATGLRHEDGTVSMARSSPGSATSSFFICLNGQPELDFGGKRNPDGQGFAAFGRVLEGGRRPHDPGRRPRQTLKPPVKIISAARVRTELPGAARAKTDG
jgi:peptidyl-prolyl cis-trans isomerase A (cyclophilin A)